MPRHRTLALLSLLVHAVIVAAICVAQLLAVGALPTPREPLIYNDARLVHLADITLPPTPPRAGHAGDSSAVTTPIPANAAPIAAPAGVAPETGREGMPDALPSLAPIEGNGSNSGLGTIGIGEAPPPPPVSTAPPMRLRSGMRPPRKLVDSAPTYPTLARTARVEGVVILEAVIDVRGHVESVRVLRSIPLLDQAAVTAVRQWQFTPTLLNGEAVPIVMTVTVNFQLSR